ncbi:hypothetical protein CAEBREN_29699 [Caenorhabditis brenneri]|uniref:Protein kinase domain-containing protein n=1 Tax=Caenorhabditis brenneri TaxID=135651 RepID=G0P3V4_CAEBE|nr:hypothetical protein CAEBREN_29699 [Caenorhabditis brenneri]
MCCIFQEEICREKKIVDRCKKSIDQKEPYDLMQMKREIELSLSKITSMKMKLLHMQNNNNSPNSTSSSSFFQSRSRLNNTTFSQQSPIDQQIENTMKLCDGANKVRESLRSEESPNEKVLRETEQTILVLQEKLELLMQCSKRRQAPATPISVRRSRDPHLKKQSLPVQVSGLLKIRVTGLSDLPRNAKPRDGRYASEYLALLIKKKKSMFCRHGLWRYHHRIPVDNDFIVVIHVGGKEVATMVWNEKKTMVGGDEESIQLYKSRQLDFEVYHTDSRSLCAIGSMQLETLLDEHDAKDPYATFAHRVVDLMPQGSLHFQTTYSDPEQSMEKKLGEQQIDGTTSRLPLSIRKSGSILARGSQRRFMPRAALSVSQFIPPSPLAQSRDFPSKKYKVHEEIGAGSFGVVHLAERKEGFCAIKYIYRDTKTGILSISELNTLKSMNHPFICTLYDSFQEKDRLILVLEFCEAGDLHTHLDKTHHGFNKKEITFFAASIVLAIEYLHRKLYIHRDLKTENMMLTRQGVLKIIDFGLCKKIERRNDKFHDTLGTWTHLAAEVVRHEAYGIEVDWWALGVSLYQLRTKALPFYGSRETEMERNSRVRDWFTFNDLLVSVSHAPSPSTCTSIYLQLMTAHPEARLGYHSTEDVKKHPFFMEIDFDAVLNGSMRPPYVPLMNPGLNLQYFRNRADALQDTSSSSLSSTNSFHRRDLTV